MDLLDRLRADVPIGQAGMGGGLAGPELAVAAAVNLLMPFVRRQILPLEQAPERHRFCRGMRLDSAEASPARLGHRPPVRIDWTTV